MKMRFIENIVCEIAAFCLGHSGLTWINFNPCMDK